MSAPAAVTRETIPIREFARREGCNEKEVRRKLQSGHLLAGDGGQPYADQVGTEWRTHRRRRADIAADKPKNVRTSSADLSAPPADRPHPAPGMSAPSGASTMPAGDADPEQIVASAHAFVTEVLAGRYSPTAEAERVKENALAVKHVLDARQRASSLVENAAVVDAAFRRARAERDAWLNWYSRVGPLLASDLGLEPDRVTELLAAHVHQQLADLGEPELDLEGGESPR